MPDILQNGGGANKQACWAKAEGFKQKLLMYTADNSSCVEIKEMIAAVSNAHIKLKDR
mgnify:CR=1 FL=1